MPLQLNTRPEHDFDQPLGLLSDCHRRVEWFLRVIANIAADARGQRLDAQRRDALAGAVRYFRTAAPKHTADEEESLFPRLRASTDPRAAVALAKIAALESDHDRADLLHTETHDLIDRWLADGTLPAPAADRLVALARELSDIYTRHIAVEDTEIFPLAGQVLDHTQLATVGAEMADRRGLTARAAALRTATQPADKRP